ncbi:MAG TPA: adenylate/guanylate cyclase domain-containing protein [Nitrososphaera sp.]|nr:adenylate/guanylate cyclase domain-containing protein [Nitrososphaera sp.]
MVDMNKNQDPASFDNYHFSNMSNRIGLPFHAPEEWQKIISPQELERLVKSADQVGVHVLVGDIRKSTFLMKESISSKRFAQITRDFMKAVRDTASKNEGWFDKFTGDGFIIYWIYGDEENQQKYISEILSFSNALVSIFPEVMNEYRTNSTNFPADIGLSLGIDSGLCSLVNIEDLNIIGSPVVGASRMVAEAEPFEVLFNVSIGARLNKDKERLARDSGIYIERKYIKTAEYGETGQEAYSVRFQK